MIAERIDHGLGPSAKAIQYSFTTAWAHPRDTNILLGLAWAYKDCGLDYAYSEAIFLWELSSSLDLGGLYVY